MFSFDWFGAKSLFYQAMASNGLGSVLRLLLLGLALCFFKHGCSFAKLQQESSASFRERSGGAIREKVTEVIKLNHDERRLLSKISAAGERRQWGAARSAFASYTGDAVPIYTAALHAAMRCQEYREGAKIFEQGQQRCEVMNAPMYTQALKIFGKLEDFAKVDTLWSEALEVCKLDEFLASARIAAAADQGDIEGAAAILDQVNASGWVMASSILIFFGKTKVRTFQVKLNVSNGFSLVDITNYRWYPVEYCAHHHSDPVVLGI